MTSLPVSQWAGQQNPARIERTGESAPAIRTVVNPRVDQVATARRYPADALVSQGCMSPPVRSPHLPDWIESADANLVQGGCRTSSGFPCLRLQRAAGVKCRERAIPQSAVPHDARWGVAILRCCLVFLRAGHGPRC